MLEPLTCCLPRLHIAAVQEELALLHAGEGVRDVDSPLADRLYLRAAQLDTALVPAQDLEIPTGFLIAGNQVAECLFLGQGLG